MTVLYDIINILPLPLLGIMLFGSYAGIPENNIIVYALCLIVSLWILFLRDMTKQNRLRSIGVVSVFITGAALAAGKEYRKLFFEEYLWVVWTVCITVAAIIAGLLIIRNIWCKRAAAAVMFIYSIVTVYFGWKISKAAFALICFVILICGAEEIQLKWKKSGDTDTREHITRISPFLLAVCIIAFMLPAPAKPYDWQLAKNIWYLAVSGVNRIYGELTHLSEDYGSIGFSDNGGFLSGINDKNENVLIITPDNRAIRDLRLVGCIGSEFKGREWVFDSDDRSRMTDTIETYTAVMKYDGPYRSDYLIKTDMNCENLFYNTKYFFAPAKIRLENTIRKNEERRKKDADIKVKDLGITESKGSIVTGNRLKFGDHYLVSCYVFNYGNPYLEDLLENAEPLDEEEWRKTAMAENVPVREGCTYADYQAYRNELQSCRSYGLSGEAKQIIDDIKDGSHSRYEAAKNLEAYLKKMEYSTDCGPLPKSVTDAGSFLDYFLFTSQKGYCMHFATAFVLMANEMGIPCRYVQGYNVHKNADGNMIVKESNAHAWPEVYFDNVGWIAFEPTPGFSVPSGWKVKERKELSTDTEKAVPEIREPEIIMPEVTEEVPKRYDPLIILIPSLSAVCFLILFYFVSRSVSRKNYKRMSCRDKFRYLTLQNLRFLKILGFCMEDGETLSEFSQRISESESDNLKDKLGFIPIYEAMLYSDKEMTETDITAAEKIYSELRELVKKSRVRSGLRFLLKK